MTIGKSLFLKHLGTIIFYIILMGIGYVSFEFIEPGLYDSLRKVSGYVIFALVAIVILFKNVPVPTLAIVIIFGIIPFFAGCNLNVPSVENTFSVIGVFALMLMVYGSYVLTRQKFISAGIDLDSVIKR